MSARFECRLCGYEYDDEDDTPYRKCPCCGYKEEREENDCIRRN